MTTRITRLTVSALSLVAVALFLGVLTGRAELFLVGVPLLATLLWTTAGTRSPECVVTHEISADRLLEGDRLTVTVTLTARSRIPMIELSGAAPRDGRTGCGARTGRPLASGRVSAFGGVTTCGVPGEADSPSGQYMCGSGSASGIACTRAVTSIRNRYACTHAWSRSAISRGHVGPRSRWETTSPQPSAKGWSPGRFGGSRRATGSGMSTGERRSGWAGSTSPSTTKSATPTSW